MFLSTLKDICLHPERCSTIILRADGLPSRDPYDETLYGLEKLEEIRLRLMPKQPKRDGKLDQRCVFFRRSETGHEGGKEEGMVLMIPEAKEAGDIPFYHPAVRKLVFRYESILAPMDSTSVIEDGVMIEDAFIKGRVSIAYLPFEPLSCPTPISQLQIPSPPARPARAPRKRSPLAGPPIGQGESTSGPIPPPAVILASDGAIPKDEVAKRDEAISEERLHRTCLGLLEKVYKYGHGNMLGYQKRVNHDVSFTESGQGVIPG